MSRLPRSRVDQPTVLVVVLIRERGCDLLDVDSGRVEHLLRLEPEVSVLEGCQSQTSLGANSRRKDALGDDPVTFRRRRRRPRR